MKPDSTPPGILFNFNAIPLWLKPDLWDETKVVRCRGLLFIVLYSLSMTAFGEILAIPIGLYKGIDTMGTTVIVMFSLSFPVGVLIGLAAWWDFVRRSRMIAVESASVLQADKPSNNREERKD